MIEATIIVCTYRRPVLLNACLASLLQQVSPFGRFEVLVVDNCSGRSAEPVARQLAPAFAARAIPLRYLVEDRTGVAFARNRGIAEASSPMVCFIDDDERALAGWLGNLLRPFAELGAAVDIVAGEIDPDFGDSLRPDWLTDDLLHIFSCGWSWDDKPRFLKPKEWVGEGNCAFRRSLFANRRFDTGLGRRGGNLMSSEGMVFTAMRRDGAAAFYEPGARVSHFIHPDRLSKRWVLQRMFFQGVSDCLAKRSIGEDIEILPVVLHLKDLAGKDVEGLAQRGFRSLMIAYYQAGLAMATNMY